jgi:replicative DNA helicase
LNIAQHVCLHKNLPVGMFSLEMSKEQLLMRMLCAEARVDAHKVRTGYSAKTIFESSSIAWAARLRRRSISMTRPLDRDGNAREVPPSEGGNTA